MLPPVSDFMKSLYLFSLILSSHFIRLEPVKSLLCGGYDAHPRQNQKAGQTGPVSASEFSIRTPLASSFSLSTSVRKLSGISASSRPPTYYKKSRHHPELFPPELLPLDPSGPCKALSLLH